MLLSTNRAWIPLPSLPRILTNICIRWTIKFFQFPGVLDFSWKYQCNKEGDHAHKEWEIADKNQKLQREKCLARSATSWTLCKRRCRILPGGDRPSKFGGKPVQKLAEDVELNRTFFWCSTTELTTVHTGWPCLQNSVSCWGILKAEASSSCSASSERETGSTHRQRTHLCPAGILPIPDPSSSFLLPEKNQKMHWTQKRWNMWLADVPWVAFERWSHVFYESMQQGNHFVKLQISRPLQMQILFNCRRWNHSREVF